MSEKRKEDTGFSSFESTNLYDDIINLPHPDPKEHDRMPLQQRGALFSPFSALTGLDEELDETATLVNEYWEEYRDETNETGVNKRETNKSL